MRLLLPEHRLQDSVAELEPRQPKLFCEEGAVISFFSATATSVVEPFHFGPAPRTNNYLHILVGFGQQNPKLYGNTYADSLL